ncbi:hypothetical protein [Rhodoblastus sp.]|uniref:hypothetical protein n=1 Tax=Rhodoblastus sp. TaxID=1962975 RepID=UPI00260BB57A|nr:hypothetical protein [Rhodoblastus sp.]
MIDMKKINKLIGFIRNKDWLAAHEFLDDEELADPGEGTAAYWRSVVLRDEGRNQEALQYLGDNEHRFACKTGVLHKRAELLHRMGNEAAALDEIEKAPFDSEIEDHWALVVDAKFFRLLLRTQLSASIGPDEWSEIPDDYVSLLPTGERISKKQLMEKFGRRS